MAGLLALSLAAQSRIFAGGHNPSTSTKPSAALGDQ